MIHDDDRGSWGILAILRGAYAMPPCHVIARKNQIVGYGRKTHVAKVHLVQVGTQAAWAKNGSPRSESLDTMLHCAIIEDFAHVLVPSMAL